MFVETPEIERLLAKRGGAIDVDALAAILGRSPPTRDEISKACTHM
jgi:hypothetical protein